MSSITATIVRPSHHCTGPGVMANWAIPEPDTLEYNLAADRWGTADWQCEPHFVGAWFDGEGFQAIPFFNREDAERALKALNDAFDGRFV